MFLDKLDSASLNVVSIIVYFKDIRSHTFGSVLFYKSFIWDYTFPPHLTQTCQRSKKPQPNLKFYDFQGDSNLCVCKAIASYLQKRLRS